MTIDNLMVTVGVDRQVYDGGYEVQYISNLKCTGLTFKSPNTAFSLLILLCFWDTVEVVIIQQQNACRNRWETQRRG